MPRPIGYVTPPAERARIAASQRNRWKHRILWVNTCKGMLAAIQSGRRREAHELLTEFMNSQ